MALSPIGNVTYINQNSQVGSVQHANNMQKLDFNLNANMQEFVDKVEAVQEVSPTPEIQEIEPDDKQEKRQNAKDTHADNQKEVEEAIIEEDSLAQAPSTHLLDIRA
ncbi:hypothetical protein LS71_008805 [Helicobacter jaachi]|uniref:Uncharacterized protein n=1 Tax=Helicobacter jaachi TaxID=1677920 RepID=A0A4U8T6A6_9HELI|nr:hypothetical protein [Helicobacter jaachi]TLD95120.1 hypothetical protein LS71_008805 [Helicobacter jaachi]